MNPEPEKTRVEVSGGYSFSKYKLPKSLSYPLKRSLLDAALRSASVYDVVWLVQYYAKPYRKTVLRALFVPEQNSVSAGGRVGIAVWPVPAQQRHATEQVLVNQGLPRLCEWLGKTRTKGNAWRGLEHFFELTIDGDTFEAVER
jgi:hypothetical protein